MRAKLGLQGADSGDGGLVDDLLDLLQAQQVDFVSSMRSLSAAVIGDPSPARVVRRTDRIRCVGRRWRRRRDADNRSDTTVAAAMDRANPIYIPRNHAVEAALSAAVSTSDLAPFTELLNAVIGDSRRAPDSTPTAGLRLAVPAAT